MQLGIMICTDNQVNHCTFHNSKIVSRWFQRFVFFSPLVEKDLSHFGEYLFKRLEIITQKTSFGNHINP